jgi:hypothetical protein
VNAALAWQALPEHAPGNSSLELLGATGVSKMSAMGHQARGRRRGGNHIGKRSSRTMATATIVYIQYHGPCIEKQSFIYQ